jgi:hypothetical protein
VTLGGRVELSGRHAGDLVGPFGSPDGSRADIDDLLGAFIDFSGELAHTGLGTRADDSKVRVIVGKLGAGKTVYMRRLQDFQSRQASVYADVPQQGPPPTEVIVRACQWFSHQVLVEKWMQIWEKAILRSLASHLLRSPELRGQLSDEDRDELSTGYSKLLSESRRPRSIYSEVRDIVNGAHTAHQLSTFLDDPLWEDLADQLAETIRHTKPIFFYLDAVDEEFSHAPMYWLKCQEGLFYQVMRLLRDHRFGGRLHVVISIRDIVMSSVYRSEHAPRYYNEPHIRVLDWDAASLRYLLRRKLARLSPDLLMRQPTDGVTARDWLGFAHLTDEWGNRERLEDYLIRHTRLIPRDVVSLGNELAEEVYRSRHAGLARVPDERVRDIVARSAKRFGDSQLAQCANQISSDMMPKDAARLEYSEVYTSTQTYIRGVVDVMRSIIRLIGADQFPRSDLEGLREIADPQFEHASDLASVLWQNGLLGYLDATGKQRFYSIGDIEEFHLPPHVDTYVLHPCLARSVGLATYRPEAPAGVHRSRDGA